MRHYADFRGRARRVEFWEVVGGWSLLTIVATVIDRMRAGNYGHDDKAITYAVAAFHLVPYAAVAARRSHDLDRTGWWALFSFVPMLSAVALFAWGLLPGSPGQNHFGAEPASEPGLQPGPEVTPRRRVAEGRLEPSLATAVPIASPPVHLGEALVLVDELERLSQLRFTEALTDDEFEVLKARLLAKGTQL